MTASDVLLLEKQPDTGIALVTLNRPEALNAINTEMWSGLRTLATTLSEDEEIRVAVFTGAGDRAFSAGMDIKAYRETPVSSGRKHRSDFDRILHMRETFDAFERLEVPCIAAIKGYCLGAGLELVLCLDIRLCDDKAQFGLPEMTLGSMPDMGSTQRLPRLIGMGMAREMVYTTRRIDAATALRLGLVNHVYPTAEVLPEALKLAAEIAQFPPGPIQNAKRALNAAFSAPLAVGLELESALSRVGRRRPPS